MSIGLPKEVGGLPEWLWPFVRADAPGVEPLPRDLGVWTKGGALVPAGGHRLFARVEGEGPVTTFLHGFPTSSIDWLEVRNRLPGERRRIYVDLLGFGASDKPRIRYSFGLQIDLLCEVWRRLGVAETVLVVHDYAVSVAQEILARIVEGSWQGPKIGAVVFLNGGLFANRYRPLGIQRVIANRWLGPLVMPLVRMGTFRRAMRRIHHPDHPPVEDWVRAQWQGIVAGGGKRVYPGLSAYHGERSANDARWRAALNAAPVPMAFLWGLADPISGAMAEDIPEVVPGARLVSWADVGHYPMVEVPGRVAAAVAALERQTVAVRGSR